MSPRPGLLSYKRNGPLYRLRSSHSRSWTSNRYAAEAFMVDWLTWPAELVLGAGGIVASWFVSKDSLSFVALQMGFALVVLAAIVSLFAYLPALVRYWRSRSQTNRPS